MQRPPSLALRLTVLFGVAAALVFSGFGWVIDRSIERHFIAGDAGELEVIAQTVQQALFSANNEQDVARVSRRFDDILVGHHHASLYVADRDGRPVFASRQPNLASLANSATGSIRRWDDADHAYRVLIRRVGEDAASGGRVYTLVAAVAIDYHLHFLAGFRRTLWLMIASGIVITSLMGWVAVRQGHAPLRRIVAQIRRISADQLHTRLSPDTVPVELTDLAVSFNDMLGRMEEAFHRLSNFSADIAHELRTPVTNLMTQTQVALSQARTLDEYREILYSNVEEYERMAQMIGDMLFLAKADNGLYEPKLTETDFAKEVQALFEYYEAWAEERGVSLSMEGNATLAADRAMLRRALSNLLSNAIRHTPRGQTVRVSLTQSREGGANIAVENPGAPIPAEHIPRLFDRFYRVDPSRQRNEDGTGLGLAIAKSIVDIHGGKIGVKSDQECTRFGMSLPASIISIPSS